MKARTYLIIGVSIGVAATLMLNLLREKWSDSGCTKETIRLDSPNGQWTAIREYKECGWGLGLNAEFAKLRIEQHGPNGWFQDLDLELDPNLLLRAPEIRWKEKDLLEIKIYSQSHTGTITLTEGQLRIVREYVRP